MFKKILGKGDLHLAWVVLIGLLVIICLVYIFSSSLTLKSLSENFFAEILGLIGTLIIVEKIIRYQKDKETEPRRKIGYRTVGIAMEMTLDYITLAWNSNPEKWDDPAYEIPDDRIELWKDEMSGINRSGAQVSSLQTLENTTDNLVSITTHLKETDLKFESVFKEEDKVLLLEIESLSQRYINQLRAMIRHLKWVEENDRRKIHKRRVDMLKLHAIICTMRL